MRLSARRGAMAALLALSAGVTACGEEGAVKGDEAFTAETRIEAPAPGWTLRLTWLPGDPPATAFGEPRADAHLAFFTSYYPAGAEARFAALGPGEEAAATAEFRDPSAPWRIGDLPSACGPEERCASPQPTIYLMVGADGAGCRGAMLATGYGAVEDGAAGVTHAEPVARPAWVGRMTVGGAAGHFFAAAAEEPAPALDPAARNAVTAAIDAICAARR